MVGGLSTQIIRFFSWGISSFTTTNHFPIGSMYGIFTHIYHKSQLNVGICTIPYGLGVWIFHRVPFLSAIKSWEARIFGINKRHSRPRVLRELLRVGGVGWVRGWCPANSNVVHMLLLLTEVQLAALQTGWSCSPEICIHPIVSCIKIRPVSTGDRLISQTSSRWHGQRTWFWFLWSRLETMQPKVLPACPRHSSDVWTWSVSSDPIEHRSLLAAHYLNNSPSEKRYGLAWLTLQLCALSHTTDVLHLCLVGGWVSCLGYRRPMMCLLNATSGWLMLQRFLKGCTQQCCLLAW